MKITRRQLKQIIKEELSRTLNEVGTIPPMGFLKDALIERGHSIKEQRALGREEQGR
jgi:hypothetical protein